MGNEDAVNPVTMIRKAADALDIAYRAAQCASCQASAQAAIHEAMAFASLALTALSPGGSIVVEFGEGRPDARGETVWTCEECGEKGTWEVVRNHDCRKPFYSPFR